MELLLARASAPQMYDNIAQLRFSDGESGEKLVTAMVSAEGETMGFRKVIRAEGRVEDWMTAVLHEMRRTNRLITKEAIFKYCEDRSRCGRPGGSAACRWAPAWAALCGRRGAWYPSALGG